MAPTKPWVVEYSKSNRSSCKTCGDKIGKDVLRFGFYVKSQQFDGFVPAWHHDACFFKKRNISSVDDLEKFDCLKWEDQKLIEGHLQGNPVTAASKSKSSGKANRDDDEDDDGGAASGGGIYAIENAKSSRGTCKTCNEKIAKGALRVATSENKRYPGWAHIECMADLPTPMDDVPGWEDLSAEDQGIVQGLIKGKAPKRKAEDESEKKGKKKQKPAAEAEDKSEDNSGKKTLEKQLEKQAKAAWNLISELKANVTNVEMKEMLTINGGKPSSSLDDLAQRCADGMMFGPLSPCPLCGGPLVFSGSEFHCGGFVSAYTKCTYTTSEAQRLDQKWEIPDDCDNDFLLKWYKNQKKKKPARVMRPKAAETGGVKSDDLKSLSVMLLGRMDVKAQADWVEAIEEAGGKVVNDVGPGDVLVTTKAECDKENPHIERARGYKVPVVDERYLTDCFKAGKKLPAAHYMMELPKKVAPAKMKVIVKGRSAVHEESGMQDKGHILEVGSDVYNVTLTQSDLTTDQNSYYILQIIEEDGRSSCHVFRRWGRVGDPSIGGSKIEQFDYKNAAIANFKWIYEDKTGNAWDSRHHFVKKPRKFCPVEIDYGESSDAPQKELSGTKSKLHPRVVNLMKMLFDIETYKAAMMEFEINTSEMPLGKLSKRHIGKAFEVLTEIQNLLSLGLTGEDVRIMDATNRFFTLIPTVNPGIINNEAILKTKIDMLEALRDIEIASQLINAGENDDEEDPLDLKYKKLNCNIAPLPHDSKEFKLVKKYLETTHAPTHTEWALELEDVFEVQREGERDLYTQMKAAMENHMLLWHGSRTTNFVGILSQGLRIAPPEAPATGYMFGKGVYFADLVSKSAQYCFTSRANPMGLMLLSEVALGKMSELKRAQYMEKPPPGYQSTKGLGKMMPDPSGFETMDDGVVVPCGKPVPSRASSDLQYNEYIVYSTAQVNLRYLLKVQFRYKR